MTVDSRSRASLAKFEALPQLMAGAPGSDDAAATYRREKRPFVEAVAFRKLETCQSGQHEFTSVVYHVVQPKSGLIGREKSFEVTELELHEARFHGAALRDDVISNLQKLP